jgi:hypothetical protein
MISRGLTPKDIKAGGYLMDVGRFANALWHLSFMY